MGAYQSKRYHGDIAVVVLRREGAEGLAGLEDYVKSMDKDGLKYVILDFNRVNYQNSDLFEIINSVGVLRKSNIGIYFCNLGNENQDPHKSLKRMRVTRLPNVHVGGRVQRTIVEILDS